MSKQIRNINIQIIQNVAHSLARNTLRWDQPIPPFETRTPNILESCVAMPFLKYDGKILYKGLIGKAAVLFYLLIKNHPFQNGNKRVAMTTLLVFLYLNEKWIFADDTELYNFAVWVAQSPPEAKDEVIIYIEKFVRKRMLPLKNVVNKVNEIKHAK